MSTTYYTAPELLDTARKRRGGARDATPAGDVYAFGMLLTRMAWPTKSMRRIISSSRAVLMSTDSNDGNDGNVDRNPFVLLLPAEMPGELAQLVSGCIAESPSERPTARDVLARVSSVKLIDTVTEEPVTGEQSSS